MLMRAVVKYPVDAPPEEKIRALTEGLQECAEELLSLGVSLPEIEEALERAFSAAEWEAESVAAAE